MSTFIPGQWSKKRSTWPLIHARDEEKPSDTRLERDRRGWGRAVDRDHLLIPYFRTTDTCPTCLDRYEVTSVDGVTVESCGCGERPVPPRSGAVVEPQREAVSRKILAGIHQSVLLVPDIERPCLVCQKLFVQTHGQQETCSYACAAARRKLKAVRKPVQEKKCIECGGKVNGRRLTCSHECLVTRRRRIQREVYRAHLLAKEIL